MHNRLLVASNNPGKVRELSRSLDRAAFEVVGPADLGISIAVEEVGSTFAENARAKAEAFCHASGMITIADDSGLIVDALDGAPGILSARYGGASASDQDRNRLVLEKLAGIPEQERTARFVAAVAVAGPARPTVVFQASVEGVIANQPRGNSGFGYDPIFYFPPYERTFGELSFEEKSLVSHRGKALRAATKYLIDEDGPGVSRPDCSRK